MDFVGLSNRQAEILLARAECPANVLEMFAGHHPSRGVRKRAAHNYGRRAAIAAATGLRVLCGGPADLRKRPPREWALEDCERVSQFAALFPSKAAASRACGLPARSITGALRRCEESLK